MNALNTAEYSQALGVQAVYAWLLIPGTMGAFILYIALDARRRWLDKRFIILESITEEDTDEYEFEK